MRLRGGFGTPCDPVHSGFIEILHNGEWGSICTDESVSSIVADVVCRQLGFPHGTGIDPLTEPSPPAPEDGSYYYPGYYSYSTTEEAEEPVDRFWLSDVSCSGTEERLVDCDLGSGFRNNEGGCVRSPHRAHIACRQFPVVEALEAVTSPEAGAVTEVQ